jgi:membrane-associated two-gene conflict system component 1 (EACC1)
VVLVALGPGGASALACAVSEWLEGWGSEVGVEITAPDGVVTELGRG